jgi:hypothetical protein
MRPSRLTSLAIAALALALALAGSCKKSSKQEAPSEAGGDASPAPAKDETSEPPSPLSCSDQDGLLTWLRSMDEPAGGERLRIERCLAVRAPDPAIYVAAVEGEAGGDLTVQELVMSGSDHSVAIVARASEHLGGMAAARWSGAFTTAADLDGNGVDELILEGETEQGGERVRFVEVARIAMSRLEPLESLITGFERIDPIVDEGLGGPAPIGCSSEVSIAARDDEVGHGAIVIKSAGPSSDAPCPPRGTTRWIAKGDRLVQFAR